MKETTKTKQLAGLFSVVALGTATATTALIDFGRGDTSAASPYNAAVTSTGSGGTTGSIALLDTMTGATGWTVVVTETGSGNGGNAGGGADVTSYPAGLAAYDTDALRNSIFANQGGGTEPAMVLLFSGLSSTATYDLLLYGSRANAQGVDQRWSLTQGTGGVDVDHNSELNDTIYVDWSSISPNGSGDIEITINSPGPDSAGALALNFASITENAVPEPSGASLLAMGLGAFFLRRKRG